MSASGVLGPKGLVASQLDRFEVRPQQLEMAKAVARAIQNQSHLMVEAGTGTGKTFAYLVPAIEAVAKDPKRRVIVSTHSINLQEQLLRKDIPFLKKVMPDPFTPVLVKGRANYISLRRLRIAQIKSGGLLEPQLSTQLSQIGKWSRETEDGSRSEIPYQPYPSVWDLVHSDHGNCLGRACPQYSRCFYFKARKQINTANLLVVNHALFFTDLALRKEGASLLPDYDVVILDEAHTLEDVAAEHMGLQISRGQIDSLLNKLHGRNQKGLFVTINHEAGIQQTEVVRESADQFFHAVLVWLSSQSRGRPGSTGAESSRVLKPNPVGDPVSEELKKLASLIHEAGANREDEEKIEFTSLANRCSLIARNIKDWLNQALPGQVYWIESSFGRFQRIELQSAPIEIGPILQQELYTKVPSVIMTSATLSIGGREGFRYFQDRLGMKSASTLQLGSPFNYEEQAELHLFRQMPDPGQNPASYEEATLVRIMDYLDRSQGRAFVLFTSIQSLRKATERLRPWCEARQYPLLSQSDGVPRSQMLEQFCSLANSVLFGVDSFWQGVDVPGDTLSNVIITKLPFLSPDRPILAARQEAIEAAGGRSFLEYQVPQAVIKLKQGFGRLIRTCTDRGMVVILDPRVITKGYGKIFLDALPSCRRFVDDIEVVSF